MLTNRPANQTENPDLLCGPKKVITEAGFIDFVQPQHNNTNISTS